jgi:hypothetical protein
MLYWEEGKYAIQPIFQVLTGAKGRAWVGQEVCISKQSRPKVVV